MKLLPRTILLLILAVVSNVAFPQSPSSNHDLVYGFDPFLYNGRIYYFYAPSGTYGTQYLADEFDLRGALTVKGVTYSNLILNYDIYNQQLIMKYVNALGSSNLVAVSEAYLESFALGNRYFELVTEAKAGKRIYQVLGNGREKIMYYYSREMLIDNAKSYRNYYFSKISMKKFISKDGTFTSFNTNRNFIKAFNPEKKELIMKYMRNKNIDVKNANDLIMTDLINYCNTLGGL